MNDGDRKANQLGFTYYFKYMSACVERGDMNDQPSAPIRKRVAQLRDDILDFFFNTNLVSSFPCKDSRVDRRPERLMAPD